MKSLELKLFVPRSHYHLNFLSYPVSGIRVEVQGSPFLILSDFGPVKHNMSARDLVEAEALLDDEEDDESYDEETGEVTRDPAKANGRFDDSSEEESDDDEEAAREVSSRPVIISHQPPCVTDNSRSERVLLSMKMKRSRTGPKGGGRERSADVRNVNEKTRAWMKMISI